MGAEDEIYEAISDITLSMRTTDYLRLPELTVTTKLVDLEPKERKAYERLRDEMVLDLNGQVIDAANVAALSGKLLQLASGAIYDEDGQPLVVHDRKLDALEDLVEAANGQPLLVAYWFKHDRERITERFPQARELKTSADITQWNQGGIPLALIHPASAGHGLNLHPAKRQPPGLVLPDLEPGALPADQREALPAGTAPAGDDHPPRRRPHPR